MEEKFYSPNDLIKITGYKYGKCCEIIRKLNQQLEKEYPGTLTLTARIPIWYFEKKTMINQN